MPEEAAEEAADRGGDEASAEHALARLVAERRFGLAHHVARSVGRPEPQVTALRLAGAAAMLTSGIGHGAPLVASLLHQQSGHVGRDTEGCELVLLPALLRVALVTGDHLAGAQLKAMAPRLPEALGEVATTVADRALSGALMIASPSSSSLTYPRPKPDCGNSANSAAPSWPRSASGSPGRRT